MQEKDHVSVLIMHLGPVLACSCVRSDPHPGNPRPRGILPLAGRRAGASAETPTPRQIYPSLLEDALPRDGSSRGRVRHLFGLSGGFRLSGGAAASVSAVSPCGEESLGVRAEESRSVGVEK